MKPSKRTQPLRATGKRRQGRALHAAQKGKPAYLETSHMRRRAALRKKKRRSRKKADPLQRLLTVRRRVL